MIVITWTYFTRVITETLPLCAATARIAVLIENEVPFSIEYK